MTSYRQRTLVALNSPRVLPRLLVAPCCLHLPRGKGMGSKGQVGIVRLTLRPFCCRFCVSFPFFISPFPLFQSSLLTFPFVFLLCVIRFYVFQVPTLSTTVNLVHVALVRIQCLLCLPTATKVFMVRCPVPFTCTHEGSSSKRRNKRRTGYNTSADSRLSYDEGTKL